MPLLAAWGDGDGVGQVMEFLLNKVALNLVAWQAEPAVIAGTVAVLMQLTRTREKQRALLQSQPLWDLATSFCDDDSPLSSLPAELQMHIAQAVCRTCSAATTVAEQGAYLFRLLEPCGNRFAALLALPGFAQAGQQPELRRHLLRALHIMRGVVRATDRNSSGAVYQYFYPHLEAMQGMLTVFAADAELTAVVLECYIDITAHWLPQLSEAQEVEKAQLLASCFNAIEAWSGAHLGRGGDPGQDVIDGLVAVMDLLQALASECDPSPFAPTPARHPQQTTNNQQTANQSLKLCFALPCNLPCLRTSARSEYAYLLART